MYKCEFAFTGVQPRVNRGRESNEANDLCWGRVVVMMMVEGNKSWGTQGPLRCKRRGTRKGRSARDHPKRKVRSVPGGASSTTKERRRKAVFRENE